MTAIGSVVLLAGTALSVLSAFGVWRFPTAISRMHAATKSASLGLALVVLGSGLAASSPGIIGIGVLTSVLLFLTAPISGHLLGRASYLTGAHRYRFDALAESRPAALRVDPASGRDFSTLRWAGLIAIWALLWRDLSVGTIVGGAVVGLVVELSRGSISNPVPVNVLALARFSGFYLAALARTNARVAWEVATPFQDDIDEAIVGIPLSVATPQAALLVANAVTFTPGTLTIELADDPLMLYAHVLHFEGEAALRAEIGRLEKLADAVFTRR